MVESSEACEYVPFQSHSIVVSLEDPLFRQSFVSKSSEATYQADPSHLEIAFQAELHPRVPWHVVSFPRSHPRLSLMGSIIIEVFHHYDTFPLFSD
jgi:hypothetical protein